MNRSSVADDVILRIVSDVAGQTQKPLHRTQLVKLIYLVDYLHSHQTGHTLTGLGYIWDNHGPNAKGNQLVIRADRLKSRGLLEIDQQSTVGGNPNYLYSPLPGSIAPKFDDAMTEAIIQLVVQDYGSKGWDEITAISKQTRPFSTAERGKPLDLSPDHSKLDDLHAIEARLVQDGPPRRGPFVTLKELKTRHGIG